jgi:hypothetical protein
MVIRDAQDLGYLGKTANAAGSPAPGLWPALRRPVIAGLISLVAMAILYSKFAIPNQSARLIVGMAPHYINSRHPINSLVRFTTSIAALLVPSASGLVIKIGLLMVGTACLGVVYAIVLLRRGADRGAAREPGQLAPAGRSYGLTLLLAGFLPILTGFVASALHLYSILTFPRLILWMLPGLALLTGAAVDAALDLARVNGDARLGQSHSKPKSWAKGIQWAALVLSALLILAMQGFLLHFPRGKELNAQAVVLLKSRTSAEDVLFLHPGVWYQFIYYSRLLGTPAGQTYIGNHQWPCCTHNQEEVAGNPYAETMEEDLQTAAARAAGHKLWVYTPTGLPSHWSAGYRPVLDQIPNILTKIGCPVREIHPLDQVQVIEAVCEPWAGAPENWLTP